MMNDHTDAELARREHAYEMGETSPGEAAWMAWCRRAEALIGCDLDADEETDGFSLDFAHDAYQQGKTPIGYAIAVQRKRQELGLPGIGGATTGWFVPYEEHAGAIVAKGKIGPFLTKGAADEAIQHMIDHFPYWVPMGDPEERSI